jgi:hypothetical protein
MPRQKTIDTQFASSADPLNEVELVGIALETFHIRVEPYVTPKTSLTGSLTAN